MSQFSAAGDYIPNLIRGGKLPPIVLSSRRTHKIKCTFCGEMRNAPRSNSAVRDHHKFQLLSEIKMLERKRRQLKIALERMNKTK